MECERIPSCYLAHGLEKLKPKKENPAGKASRSRILHIEVAHHLHSSVFFM
jgi:hypothetical protein